MLLPKNLTTNRPLYRNLTNNLYSKTTGAFPAMSVHGRGIGSHSLTKGTITCKELLLTDIHFQLFPQVVTCTELVVQETDVRMFLDFDQDPGVFRRTVDHPRRCK